MRLLRAELFDDRGQVCPARGLGDLIQSVKDHQRCLGGKQPLDSAGRSRALIEGLQFVRDIASVTDR